MKFLVDYNLDGYASVFLGILTKNDWLQLLAMSLVTLKEARLSMDTSDRILWRFAQSNQMIILTANRKKIVNPTSYSK